MEMRADQTRQLLVAMILMDIDTDNFNRWVNVAFQKLWWIIQSNKQTKSRISNGYDLYLYAI
jgi:hypothetical protein